MTAMASTQRSDYISELSKGPSSVERCARQSHPLARRFMRPADIATTIGKTPPIAGSHRFGAGSDQRAPDQSCAARHGGLGRR